MNSIEAYLEQDAQRCPDKVALISSAGSITYSQLWQQVLQRADGLPRRQFIPFRASQTADFLIQYFAIHLAGSVAVPLERDIPEGRYQSVCQYLARSEVPGGAADVLFTTGTTGRPKGVVISHSAIVADAENLIEGQGYSSRLTFVVHGPLSHIGSLSKVWPVILKGATLHILDGLRDADAFFRAFSGEGRYATFFVPANIRYLLSFDSCRFASLADRLDFIESGGAPLAHADMLRLCQMLPRTRLYNTYASTETGIVATYNFNLNSELPVPAGGGNLNSELPAPVRGGNLNSEHPAPVRGGNLNSELPAPVRGGNFNSELPAPVRGGDRGGVCGPADCLGRPMRHSRVVITPDGLIACQGDTLMSGYVGDPDLTVSVLCGQTVYTSDRGWLDGQGRLHIGGRADDIINVGGYKVAPTEVEDAALAIPGIKDCICISAPHPIMGRALKLLVVMADGTAFSKRAVARSLAATLEPYKVPLLYEQVSSVARTYNGKLDRRHYHS